MGARDECVPAGDSVCAGARTGTRNYRAGEEAGHDDRGRERAVTAWGGGWGSEAEPVIHGDLTLDRSFGRDGGYGSAVGHPLVLLFSYSGGALQADMSLPSLVGVHSFVSPCF